MAIRYQQPQGSVQINWNNPLAPKTGLWVPDRNIVTGKQPTFTSTGNVPRKIITRSGVELFSDGQIVQTDLPAQAFSVLTWCMLLTPLAAPSGANYSSALQTTQATLNWNHLSTAYQGSFTLFANGTYPTCKFVNGFTDGQQVLLHGTYDGTTICVYRNGVLENTTAASNGVSGVTVESLQFLGGSGGTAPFAGSVAYVSWDTTRALSSAQVRAHANNIYQVFQPQARSLWLAAAAGGGSTGTLARTNGADTSAAVGAITITGTLAKSNSNSTSAAGGTTTIRGSVAKANGNDNASGTGSTSIIGLLARSNANDSVTAAGATGAISGTVAVTNRNDTSVSVPMGAVPAGASRSRATEHYGMTLDALIAQKNAAQVIAKVAIQQANTTAKTAKSKRQLRRAIEQSGLAWNGFYADLLGQARGQMLNEQLSAVQDDRLLKAQALQQQIAGLIAEQIRMDDDDAIMLLLSN